MHADQMYSQFECISAVAEKENQELQQMHQT